jgi:hypothetical protein
MAIALVATVTSRVQVPLRMKCCGVVCHWPAGLERAGVPGRLHRLHLGRLMGRRAASQSVSVSWCESIVGTSYSVVVLVLAIVIMLLSLRRGVVAVDLVCLFCLICSTFLLVFLLL